MAAPPTRVMNARRLKFASGPKGQITDATAASNRRSQAKAIALKGRPLRDGSVPCSLVADRVQVLTDLENHQAELGEHARKHDPYDHAEDAGQHDKKAPERTDGHGRQPGEDAGEAE